MIPCVTGQLSNGRSYRWFRRNEYEAGGWTGVDSTADVTIDDLEGARGRQRVR